VSDLLLPPNLLYLRGKFSGNGNPPPPPQYRVLSFGGHGTVVGHVSFVCSVARWPSSLPLSSHVFFLIDCCGKFEAVSDCKVVVKGPNRRKYGVPHHTSYTVYGKFAGPF
jgi:hypothetical protein